MNPGACILDAFGQHSVKPLDFPSKRHRTDAQKNQNALGCLLAVDAVAYVREHISINIAHSSQRTPTDNLDAAQRSAARRAIGLSKRQQPEFIVNLVELARRSLNIYLKQGKILWPE